MKRSYIFASRPFRKLDMCRNMSLKYKGNSICIGLEHLEKFEFMLRFLEVKPLRKPSPVYLATFPQAVVKSTFLRIICLQRFSACLVKRYNSSSVFIEVI